MKTKYDRFLELGGEIIPFHDWKRGVRPSANSVAIIEMPDECSDFNDLCGDCFDPSCNPDKSETELEEERESFLKKVNRDGVFGYQSVFFDGNSWIEVDSVFGLVGGDFNGSGHDEELAGACVDAFESVQKEQASLVVFSYQLETV